MPKLSVIIPVYNVEKYISKCLDSLINQTFKDIEIICVDDCGTDDSIAIVKQYMQKDKRIHLIHQDKNRGPAASRNIGIQNASAELIAFIDSDDFLDLDTYEKAIQKMTPDIDLVCFGIQICGGDAKQKKYDEDYYRIKFNGKTTISEDVLWKTDVSPCNKIFRKSTIDKYHILYPDGLRYEDAYFWTIYGIRSSSVFFMPNQFYHYIRHENSIMSNTFSGTARYNIDHLKITFKIYEYLQQNDLFIKYKNYFYRLFFAFLNLALSHEKTHKGQDKIYDMAIKFLKDEKIVLSNSAEFSREYQLLKNRTLLGGTKKYFFHSLKIKTSRTKKTYYLFGIPLLRIKYKNNQNRHYLFSILPIFKKRMCSSPRVSVLMPAYNAEKYIAQAIESILNQTFSDFEFIIINDGSTDNTAHIIKQYHDERIIFIDNPKNQGLVSVLNQGLDIAQGEYIARMDADDISLPERLKKQVRFMDNHPKVGILGTWFHIFGSIVNQTETKLKYPKLKDMIKTPPVGHPTAMFRKSIFDKYHLRYNPTYKHAEDYELWIKAIMYTKIANLQEVLLHYRYEEGNISTKYQREQFLKSSILKQKIKKQVRNKISCAQLHLDDTHLLAELNKMDSFAYMPNSGNMGDMFIAGATMQWLDDNKLNWHQIKEGEKPKNFVYGGGGAWLHEWIECMKQTMEIMQSADRVIILPSSFNDVPEFVRILDERFTVFCREKKSYDYLKSHKTKAKILLDHDMALRMSGRVKNNIKAPTKKLKELEQKLGSALSLLPKDVRLFRKDSESAGHYETDLDLSDTLGWFSQYESRENIDFTTTTMLRSLYKFDTIRTDRLHVAIAGALTGADVILCDNSYGKISGVYRQSLSLLPNVQFHQEGK